MMPRARQNTPLLPFQLSMRAMTASPHKKHPLPTRKMKKKQLAEGGEVIMRERRMRVVVHITAPFTE
jgi:hypothetical protein